MRNPTKRGPMILVTGATGGVGRHVVSGLLAEGFTVRAMSRDPDTARLPPGGDVVRGDLADAASLAAVLAGVESVWNSRPTLPGPYSSSSSATRPSPTVPCTPGQDSPNSPKW